MRLLLLLAVVVSWAAACAGETLLTAEGPVEVGSWGYQLQGLDSAALSMAPHDFLVVEPCGAGDEGSPFTPDQVRAMQRRPADSGQRSRRVVVAYVSIGEVEDFRAVWRREWTTTGKARGRLTERAPAWLGPVNPDWPESRKVRYWDPEWRRTLIRDDRTGAIDKIVAQGFDGAYLDIVDAYYFWGDEAPEADRRPGDPEEGQDAARRMVELVVALARRARETNPAFFLVPQNGEFVLSDLRHGPDARPGDAGLAAAFVDAIGAIGVEDLYHPGDAPENNPARADRERVAVLKEDFLGAGKPVLVVDYLNRPAQVRDFAGRARRDGFVPYAAPTRGLDRLASPAK